MQYIWQRAQENTGVTSRTGYTLYVVQMTRYRVSCVGVVVLPVEAGRKKSVI